MREILFRGKRLDNGEWVEGYLGQDTIIGNGKTWLGYVIKPIPEKLWDCDWFEVDPATVGQFTGLLDKNGKRIFEGDKLLVVRHKGDFKYHCVVRDIRNLPELMFGSSVESIEVIGTIHDNSELLEVTPDA